MEIGDNEAIVDSPGSLIDRGHRRVPANPVEETIDVPGRKRDRVDEEGQQDYSAREDNSSHGFEGSVTCTVRDVTLQRPRFGLSLPVARMRGLQPILAMRILRLILLACLGSGLLSCGGDGPQGPEGSSGNPGTPQPVDVLLAGAELTSALEEMVFVAIREGLFPLGSTVNYVSLIDSVPPLDVLREYDAVLAWSGISTFWSYPDSIGDVLADYVDAGGGVVLAEGAFIDGTGLAGRIMSPGYSPFGRSTPTGGAGDRMIDPLSVDRPIPSVFHGTDLFDFTFSATTGWPDPPLDEAATLFASDDLGKKTIAIAGSGRVIAVNMYPENDFSGNYTSAIKLIGNSLLLVAGAF